MEIQIFELVLIFICGLIFGWGVLIPIYKTLLKPVFAVLFRFLYSVITSKSDLEKQEEALKTAKQRVKIAQIQKETVQTEMKAMKIQNSILDEEFEELDEKDYFESKR